MALIVAGGGAWYFTSGSGGKPDEALLAGEGAVPQEVVQTVDLADTGIAGAVTALITDAQKGRRPGRRDQGADRCRPRRLPS